MPRQRKAANDEWAKLQSVSSRNYERGSTVRYGYRIRGPISPPVTRRHQPTCISIIEFPSTNCTCQEEPENSTT